MYRNVGRYKLTRHTVEFMRPGNDSTFLRLIASQEERNFLRFVRKKGVKKKAKVTFALDTRLKFSKETFMC